jgi:large subunit ribosomal protein LP0
MNVKKVYDEGSIFNAEVLDITPEDIREKFKKAISNMASVSLASGYITKPAIPHLVANAFKNLAAVTFASDVSFKQAEKMKEAAKNSVVYAPAAGAPAGGAKPK